MKSLWSGVWGLKAPKVLPLNFLKTGFQRDEIPLVRGLGAESPQGLIFTNALKTERTYYVKNAYLR
jgi:hypothetical protein